ncbi:hypothetical protein BU16DRAFT_540438 [Lophium mytilinum]|uniref:Uncharacterized protein n=1 Tax=Lophium mytilinum TaxID=390894 RepID=A0A6A6QNE7_9PEZI|nr:hypothetical protein BU16DRAFT_540438 [Lophium mytilinum]
MAKKIAFQIDATDDKNGKTNGKTNGKANGKSKGKSKASKASVRVLRNDETGATSSKSHHCPVCRGPISNTCYDDFHMAYCDVMMPPDENHETERRCGERFLVQSKGGCMKPGHSYRDGGNRHYRDQLKETKGCHKKKKKGGSAEEEAVSEEAEAEPEEERNPYTNWKKKAPVVKTQPPQEKSLKERKPRRKVMDSIMAIGDVFRKG